MILAFEENEENILNRILSCISKEADVLKHEVIHKEELSFKGLYIDKYKRIVVREDTERVGEAFKDGLKLKKQSYRKEKLIKRRFFHKT